MKEEKQKLIDSMQSLLDTAKTEMRGLTSEESESFSKMEAEVRSMEEVSEERSLEQAVSEEINTEERILEQKENKTMENVEYRTAYFKALAGKEMTGEEKRVLDTGTSSQKGGNTVPEEFAKEMMNRLLNLNPFRSLCDVRSTGSTHNITIDGGRPTAAIVAESGSFSDDTGLVYERISLDAYKLGVLHKVTDELLQDTMFNLEADIMDKVSQAIAAKEEELILVGTGSSQPQGLAVVTSVGGISVSTTTLAGTAAVTADELVDIMYDLKPQYRKNAVWVMSNSTMRDIAKLKDGNNQYLLTPGLTNKREHTLLGHKVIVSDSAIDMAASARSIIFGDLKYYVIADRGNMEIRRLNELYAANGQVAFRFHKRFDAKLANAEAIVVGVNAAS